MPVHFIAVLAIVLTVAGCYPDKECAGELVFDEVTALCYECPKGSKYRNQTCECGDGYAFIGMRCVLMDGAMPPMPDAGPGSASDASTDAAAYEGASCAQYCSFANTCIGKNVIATAYLADSVTALNADNTSMCESNCKSKLGSAEATDPGLACLVAGEEAAMCTDPDPQAGLMNTFGLIGNCCRTRLDTPLCKSICAVLKADPLAGSMIDFCG